MTWSDDLLIALAWNIRLKRGVALWAPESVDTDMTRFLDLVPATGGCRLLLPSRRKP
jgi:hypothetical protein